MQQYPAYKDSGLYWLGEIPSHWDTLAIKRIVTTPVTDGPHETPEFLDDGIPFVSAEAVKNFQLDFSKKRGFISPQDHAKYSKKYKPKRGDIYIVKSGATTGNVAVVETDEEFNIWSPLAAIRPNPKKALTRFVYFFMRSRHFFQAIATKWSFGTQQNIGMGVIENIRITLPPLDEQKAIADYLDEQTAVINQFLTNKRRLIALLEEQKQVVINTAVTQGLETAVGRKPSGIDWLGNIPAHWTEKRAKYFFYEVNERSETGEEELLSVSHITGVTPRSEKNITMFQAESYEGYKTCQPDDLVINIMWAWMGAMGVSQHHGIISSAYGVYRQLKSNTFYSPYLDHLVRVNQYIAEYTCRSTGIRSSRLRMYTDDFFDMPIICPPYNEQVAIVQFIDDKTAEINAAIERTQREIELIEEYRTTLIAHAVTGKIDVRSVV